MRDIYSIYIVFLVAVALRYAWAVYRAVKFGVEEPEHDQVEDTAR
jgi:C4-dicarboxylate transporter DctQ subunit